MTSHLQWQNKQAKNMSKVNNKCECCGQSLYTTSKLSKGNAEMMISIQKFIGQKGINVFHPKKELLDGSFITANQRGNISHLGNHGLIAKHHEAGNWVLTTKGLDFLKGVPVKKTAVIEKSSKTTVGYLTSDGFVTIQELMKSQPYWDVHNFEVKDGKVIYENRESATQGRLGII